MDQHSHAQSADEHRPQQSQQADAEPASGGKTHGSASKNPGNFANDRAKAVEAGRRGGQHSHGGGGASNNPGNFANNRQRAAEAGRKGGMQPRR